MQRETKERWIKLCERAAVEQDSKKLMELIDEINKLLQEKEKQQKKAERKRVLSVSYDPVLLQTRHMLLEAAGYGVVSALGFEASLEQCNHGDFDVLVLGHSINHPEKIKMVETFRSVCPGVIIALRRTNEPLVRGADYEIEPDPELLLKLIAEIFRKRDGEGGGEGDDDSQAAAG
jgi:hypothetical protein